jgi:predicted DNA-binding transcriptional regulator AlpA
MKNCKPPSKPAVITLAEACRRTGIAVGTALRLAPNDFPRVFWLGGKRVVPREEFENWLARKIGKI